MRTTVHRLSERCGPIERANTLEMNRRNAEALLAMEDQFQLEIRLGLRCSGPARDPQRGWSGDFQINEPSSTIAASARLPVNDATRPLRGITWPKSRAIRRNELLS